MSNRMRGLETTAAALVDEDFRRGEKHLKKEDFASHLVDLEIEFEIEDFNETIEESIESVSGTLTSDEEKAEHDASLSKEIHKNFSLTRREASDWRLWNYLTVVENPDYVRFRWGKNPGRNRFMGRTRPQRNAFARLWWLAEITYDKEKGYALTEKMFKTSQDIPASIFGRGYGKYSPAAKALANIAEFTEEDVTSKLAQETGKMLNKKSALYVLDSMSYTEISHLLTEILSDQ